MVISRKKITIAGFAIVAVLLLGGGACAYYFLWGTERGSGQVDLSGEAIGKLNETAYGDLDEKTADEYSKLLFGTDTRSLNSDVLLQDDISADSARAAASLLAASDRFDDSIKMFEYAGGKDGVVFDVAHVNALDDAGRHQEATALYQKRLDVVRRDNPGNQEQIAKIEGQINARKDIYK